MGSKPRGPAPSTHPDRPETRQKYPRELPPEHHEREHRRPRDRGVGLARKVGRRSRGRSSAAEAPGASSVEHDNRGARTQQGRRAIRSKGSASGFGVSTPKEKERSSRAATKSERMLKREVVPGRHSRAALPAVDERPPRRGDSRSARSRGPSRRISATGKSRRTTSTSDTPWARQTRPPRERGPGTRPEPRWDTRKRPFSGLRRRNVRGREAGQARPPNRGETRGS